MSRFKVFVLPRAQDDVHSIFEWLNERSIEGAQNWLGQFEQMLASLAENADSFGEAEEGAGPRSTPQAVPLQDQEGTHLSSGLSDAG